MAVDDKRSPSPFDEPGEASPQTAGGEGEEKSASLLSGGAAAVFVLILLVLMPIFYVLSIGPVVWLNDRNYINVDESSVVMTFYAPLIYVHEYAPALAAPLDWYVGLWESSGPPQVAPITPPLPVPAQIPAPVPMPERPQVVAAQGRPSRRSSRRTKPPPMCRPSAFQSAVSDEKPRNDAFADH